ncbi:MAG: hypothetical protein LCH73_13335 [Proteobacteria bacterium]|nr:hypothetical protein [Pseudomonadota bacterium]
MSAQHGTIGHRGAVVPGAATGSRHDARWWLRWLLVLILVTDQVGAPLHEHRHDSGVDGTAALLTEHSAWSSEIAHAEHMEHNAHLPDFTHITTGLRADPRPAARDPATGSTDVLLAAIPLAPMRDHHARPSVASSSQRVQAPRLVQQNLPPEGRAPPHNA